MFDWLKRWMDGNEAEARKFSEMHRRAQAAESEAARLSKEARVLRYRLDGALQAMCKARSQVVVERERAVSAEQRACEMQAWAKQGWDMYDKFKADNCKSYIDRIAELERNMVQGPQERYPGELDQLRRSRDDLNEKLAQYSSLLDAWKELNAEAANCLAKKAAIKAINAYKKIPREDE